MIITAPEDLGNIIRDRRLDLGLSQADLADAIGMSRQWVVRFEGGHAATATLEHLTLLTRSLGLNVDVKAASVDVPVPFVAWSLKRGYRA